MRIRTARELGGFVRDEREKAGWSRQALAERSGTSREWIVRREGGESSVRMDRVFDVLRALDVVVDREKRFG
ncbi:helix-turn-helix domain-containing protein [Microbacterium sp.]|uniref:helix-turn-helix domain-containing protein n=1 Tax=Microbacterium sp. TaxID=51671 RepID=UPI0039E34EC9